MNTLPIRDMQRLGHILLVVAQNGWGPYVDRLRLRRYLPGKVRTAVPGMSDAQRLRMVLEELGPTFIKFGQMLSVRQDVLSPDFIRELQQLQDNVPPFPVQQVHEMIVRELGKSAHLLFFDFDDIPLAAASIAQAHAAVLMDGTAVVVKIQRPHIEQVIAADLEIMFFIARLLHRHMPSLRIYDPVGLVEEFSETILRELDFHQEGRNAERFQALFNGDAIVTVPPICWKFSSRRILTLHRCAGQKISALYPAAAKVRRRLAEAVMRAFFVQAFEAGFFHGDPHPGNVFVTPDAHLCYLDFGIMGQLSPRSQKDLHQIFLALISRDAEWMADVYVQMGVTARSVDRARFIRDLEKALEQYYLLSAHAYSFAEMLRQFMSLGHKYEVRVPRELLLATKAFMETEALAHMLDPSFDTNAALRAYVPRMLLYQVVPASGGSDALIRHSRLLFALQTMATELPRAILTRMQQPKAGGEATEPVAEGTNRRMHWDSPRLRQTIFLATLFASSTVLMVARVGPLLQDVSLVGLAGYLVTPLLAIRWGTFTVRKDD